MRPERRIDVGDAGEVVVVVIAVVCRRRGPGVLVEECSSSLVCDVRQMLMVCDR